MVAACNRGARVPVWRVGCCMEKLTYADRRLIDQIIIEAVCAGGIVSLWDRHGCHVRNSADLKRLINAVSAMDEIQMRIRLGGRKIGVLDFGPEWPDRVKMVGDETLVAIVSRVHAANELMSGGHAA